MVFSQSHWLAMLTEVFQNQHFIVWRSTCIPESVQATAIKRAVFILAAALPLLAQTAPAPTSNNGADTPNRAVARISFMSGEVSVRRGDSGEAVAAAVDAPLTGTDRLLTGDQSRAEIQFDAINMIRLAPMTEVRLGDLGYHQYQIDVATGTTEFRVLRENDAQVEISTPSVAVRPLQPGVYIITVRADGSSQITVRSGEAAIESPKGTQNLAAGKTLEARGSADDPEVRVVGAIAVDSFGQWNDDRDHELEQSGSGRYVNPDINGTEELDKNGRWEDDPSYGQVWVPAVDPGWAPYRVGRWVWVDYYGWTWVSADPWGWAPYHYGRWYQSPYGWAWWPGAIYGPDYWRPALVGFFGWGGVGVGVGFGFGNVGWVPLAPYERFNPWYGPGVYGRGFGAVNIARGVNVTSLYRNARVSNGVTSMAANQFGRSGVSASNYVRANAADLSRAGAVRGSVPIAPSRESTHFSSASASTSGMPHANGSSRFYSSHASAGSAASHVSFDQQRQAMTRSISNMNAASSRAATRTASSPSGPSSYSSGNTGGGVSVRNPGTTSGSAQSSGGGWQRMSGTSATTAARSCVLHCKPSASGADQSSGGAEPRQFNRGPECS